MWRQDAHNGKPGRPRTYADTAILCRATLEEIHHLPLRATEGLLLSIFQLMKLALPVPDDPTLCRRRRGLEGGLQRRAKQEPLHLVVDSTGVKIFGDGEWKVCQHGDSKRRTWRKLHLSVDEATGEIVAAVVTTNDVTDGQVLPDWLDHVEDPIEQVSGGGASDKRKCYHAIRAR